MMSFCFDRNSVKQHLPQRRQNSHKGDYGRVLICAGSEGMAGAAYLAGLSCFRTGAGMVRFYSPPCNRTILQTLLPEAMVTVFPKLEEAIEWADVIAAGPGMGCSRESAGIIDRILNERKPLILDADALNLIAMHNWQGRLAPNMILTPHLGEYRRLTEEAPEKFSAEYQCILVLKSPETHVYNGTENVYLNKSGCSALAKAGSGDVLTGVIAGLAAQGASLHMAACLGVYLHGLAGERSAEVYSEYGTLAGDVAENIPGVIKECIQ